MSTLNINNLEYYQIQKTEKFFTRESYEFIILFLFSALIVYFSPAVVGRLFFLIILLQYYRSKKNYFWIALTFIFLNTPAGFFSGTLATDTQRLPLYTFGAGMSLSFFDLFFIVSIIKTSVNRRNKSEYYFRKPLNIIIIFGIVLLLYSLLLGMSEQSIITFGRTTLLPFLFFLVAPRLISDTSSFLNLFKLVLPYVVLSFIGQLYEITYDKYLISIIKPDYIIESEAGILLDEGVRNISRYFDSEYLNIFSIIFCSFYILKVEKVFNPLILFVFIFLNIFICYTSATRGPFLTFMVILITLSFLFLRSSVHGGKKLKYILFIPIIVLILLLAIRSNSALSTQIEGSTERLSSIETLIKEGGKYEPEGGRLDRRIPLLMKKFKESPIVGWGFSDKGESDSHVGFHNMMVEGGIIELFIFLILFYHIVNIPLTLSKMSGIYLNEKHLMIFMAIAFLSLMIKHASSSQLFGYNIGFSAIEKWYMISLILTGFNIYYWQTKSEIDKRADSR